MNIPFQRWLQRRVPRPGLALALWAVWLLLQQSLDAGQVLLGAALALLLAGLAPHHEPTLPGRPIASRITAGLRLVLVVLIDILRANLQVALQILGPQARLQTAWIDLPLQVKSDLGITLLTHIITMTPGTVSARISSDRKVLHVHALHAPDPQAVIESIRSRYECLVIALCDPSPEGSTT